MPDLPEAERPSRQGLVVPPSHSNLPVVIGAVVCATLGFGSVWVLGIGRHPPAAAVAAAEQVDEPQAPPARLPLVDEEPRQALPTNDRWQPRTPEVPPAHDDRYPARPASLDVPAATVPTLDHRPLSRFSRGSFPADPDDAPAAAAVEPLAATEPARDVTPEITTVAATDATPPPERLAPQAAKEMDAELSSPPPDDTAAHEPLPDALEPDPAATSADDSDPSAAAPPAQPEATDVAPPPRLQADAPASPLAAPVASSATPPVATPPVATPVVPAGPPPAAAFAAAPPIMPRAGSAATTQPTTPAEATGQGRPGPLQLEGVQTPQLAVEKRGPREIQVGKPARYEILVRNIGSATAHELTLRDAVPSGTTLVTTTPPASPVAPASATAANDLVWSLGTLPPGGQARVTMEVLPQIEGEIGSVASVSFRADASVRSRATKPDLQIECATPAPVLIGRDMQLTITITNPGSGVATGVVLEGFLPENVSHRSGRELEFDVGQLRPGESRTIDLVLGTRGPGVHAARLAARGDGGIEVEHQVPLEVTAPTLALAVDMPLRRFLQRPATCSISMVNAGTAPARAIELAAQLPPGMKFVRANNAGWHDDRTHRVLWNLEELPAGETGTVEVVVMPVDLGQQKIVAAARSADGLADQVAHVCEVEGLAALVFDVVDSEDPIEVQGVTEYVIRVRNQGTKPATGVRLTASLLGDLEPLQAQGPAGHRVANLTVSFEPLAKLAPLEEALFRIRVRGSRAGDHRIQVRLESADHPAPITKEEITRVYSDR
jgi:uncharacterized repeat protein (TIGR01451 family)